MIKKEIKWRIFLASRNVTELSVLSHQCNKYKRDMKHSKSYQIMVGGKIRRNGGLVPWYLEVISNFWGHPLVWWGERFPLVFLPPGGLFGPTLLIFEEYKQKSHTFPKARHNIFSVLGLWFFGVKFSWSAYLRHGS